MICFVGVTIIFSKELMFSLNSLWGGIAVIVSAGCAGCANVVGKKYSSFINSTVNLAVQMGVGAILLVAAGLVMEHGIQMNFNSISIFAILYLAVIGSVIGFAALYWLFGHMEVTRTSLFTFITPIVAVLLGWFMLGERIDLNVALGGCLILVGVVLVNQAPRTG